MSQVPDEGASRSKALTRGIATSLVTRVVTLGVPLVLIPTTYREFGAETYAVWSAVVATTSMFLWADLGLGNGLLTKLTPALAKGHLVEARQLISSAYSTLTLAAVVLLGLLATSLKILPLESMLGLQDGGQVRETVAVCLGLLFANLPFALVQRVQYSAQQVASSNLLQAIGPCFTLVGAMISIGLGAPSLLTIAVIALGPLVSSAVASVAFYSRRPELRPSFVSPWNEKARTIIVLGLSFLFIQLVSSVAMNSDALVVAHLVPVVELADFTVTMRIFLVLGAFITVVMLPLWPANAEAIARGDLDWVRRQTLRMSVAGGTVGCAGGLALVLMGPWLFPRLLGERYAANTTLMIGFMLLWTVVGIASPLFMAQNAAGVLLPQMIAWPVYVVFSLSVKFLVGRELGVEWVPAAGALTYAVLILGTAILGYRLTLRRVARTEVVREAGAMSERDERTALDHDN